MTGAPNLPAPQLGFANARTLQAKLGVPAVAFGLVQFAVLLAIYRALLRREHSQHERHEQHQKEAAGQDA